MTPHDDEWFEYLLEKLAQGPGFMLTQDHDGRIVVHRKGCEAIARQGRLAEKTIYLNQLDRLCNCMLDA